MKISSKPNLLQRSTPKFSLADRERVLAIHVPGMHRGASVCGDGCTMLRVPPTWSTLTN